MIKIKILIFNAFQVNTYILYDESKECIIVDPACYDDYENKKLVQFIEDEGLKPVKVINTHCHVDHILGNSFIEEKYGLKPIIHPAGESFLKVNKEYALSLGFTIERIVFPDEYLNEGDIVKFGDSELKILYTPGHADGSICLHSEEQKFVIVGDVLFLSGIGRTDFPTGNYDILIDNIKRKLLTLNDDTIVYSGHGPETMIGQEKKYNDYLI